MCIETFCNNLFDKEINVGEKKAFYNIKWERRCSFIVAEETWTISQTKQIQFPVVRSILLMCCSTTNRSTVHSDRKSCLDVLQCPVCVVEQFGCNIIYSTMFVQAVLSALILRHRPIHLLSILTLNCNSNSISPFLNGNW